MNPMKTELITLDDARHAMLSPTAPVIGTEKIPLAAAAGRVTARPIISPSNIPAFANAAMDGYALRKEDLASRHRLPVVGKSFAGNAFQGEWPPGTCIRIMTGAPVPAGTEAVVMQEETTLWPEGIRLTMPVVSGQNIRFIGEDIPLGKTVIDEGSKLTIRQLPLLAALGINEITVRRKLGVALFSTGDELQPVGVPLADGQLYDINRFTIGLMLEQMGCKIDDLGIIPDDPRALAAAFQQANQLADVVISSGGVSVGDMDHIKTTLQSVGKIHFWKLAIKPGKPFAFGQLTNSWFCGLPGNPVSAAVTFYQLVQPFIARLQGQSASVLPVRLKAKTQGPLRKSPGRLDFQRGIFRCNQHGELEVAGTGDQGSHIFSSFNRANCFIILEQQRSDVSAGEWVDIEPFNALLG